MRGVVSQVVTRLAMHKHIQSLAFALQPRDERIKLPAVKGQLATPLWVRADLPLMHPAYGDAKRFTSGLAKRTRLPYGVWPEVNMGVVVVVDVFGSFGHGNGWSMRESWSHYVDAGGLLE